MKNIDIFLAILGVLITIIIGIIGVKYTFKQQKRTELTFFKNTCISLFKAIVQNLDGIEIKYQGNRIGENLILFKGTIFNTGNIDIDKSIIHKPLTIELPKTCSWIKYKIIDKSDGLDVEPIKEENNVVFNWELLKEGEYFTFDSLIEYHSDSEENKNKELDLRKDLLEKISFNTRITNLKSVKKEISIPRLVPFGILIFLSIVLLNILLVGSYNSFGQFIFPKYEIYYEFNRDSIPNYIKLKPIDTKTVELLNSKDKELAKISLDEFQKQSSNNISIKKKKIDITALITGGLFAVICLIFLIVMIVNEMNDRRLYKKLRLISDKYDNSNLGESIKRGFMFPFRLK